MSDITIPANTDLKQYFSNPYIFHNEGEILIDGEQFHAEVELESDWLDYKRGGILDIWNVGKRNLTITYIPPECVATHRILMTEHGVDVREDNTDEDCEGFELDENVETLANSIYPSLTFLKHKVVKTQ